MENVVKFAARLPSPDPLREHRMAIQHAQLSLAQNAKTLTSILISLGETLQKSDGIICCIDDAEVRAQLQLTSKAIHSELWAALAAVIKLSAVCQKTNT